MSATAQKAQPPVGSVIEQMAALLENSKDESEVIVSRDLLLNYAQELGARAETGVALEEATKAVRTAQIHPRLVQIMGEAWKQVVVSPNFVQMSHVGLEQLIRQALASSKALIPPTVGMPSDGILEIPMMALLLRLIAVVQGK